MTTEKQICVVRGVSKGKHPERELAAFRHRTDQDIVANACRAITRKITPARVSEIIIYVRVSKAGGHRQFKQVYQCKI